MFFIACIPIITIFPATAAMYGVIRQWKLNKGSAVVEPFVEEFKVNFKQSFKISLLWIPIAILLYIDYLLISHIQPEWKIMFVVPLFLITVIFLSMSTFLFPVIVHYKLVVKNVFKNTFMISLTYFPITLLQLLIGVILVGTLIVLPIASVFIFSIGTYINFLICNRVFEKNERIHYQHINNPS